MLRLCKCLYKALGRVEYYKYKIEPCIDRYEPVLDCKFVDIKLTILGRIKYFFTDKITANMIKEEIEV